MNHQHPKAAALAAASLLALTMSTSAFGSCSQSTKIKNNSGITLRIAELKSSASTPSVFKSQWKGSRVIAPGATATIGWTSDYACVDTTTGLPNHWDVKLIRNNGNKHYCGGLAQSQDVNVNTPDLCFAQ